LPYGNKEGKAREKNCLVVNSDNNIIMRKRVLEQSTFIVQQKLGDSHLTLSELKEKLQTGDQSIANKILYFSENQGKAREKNCLVVNSDIASFFLVGQGMQTWPFLLTLTVIFIFSDISLTAFSMLSFIFIF
jgi:hypothetical protein